MATAKTERSDKREQNFTMNQYNFLKGSHFKYLRTRITFNGNIIKEIKTESKVQIAALPNIMKL